MGGKWSLWRRRGELPPCGRAGGKSGFAGRGGLRVWSPVGWPDWGGGRHGDARREKQSGNKKK